MTATPYDLYQSLHTQVYDLEIPDPWTQEYAFYRNYVAQCKGPRARSHVWFGMLPIAPAGGRFDVYGFDASKAMLDA